MKFLALKNKKQKKQAVRLLKIIFPALGAVEAWQFFYKRKRSTQFFHVQKKKKTLGLVGVSTLVFLGVRVFYLHYLAVDKRTQGKGVGTEILRTLEKRAKKEKHDFMFLTSSMKRKSAHGFYKKNGFYKIFWSIFWKKLK